MQFRDIMLLISWWNSSRSSNSSRNKTTRCFLENYLFHQSSSCHAPSEAKQPGKRASAKHTHWERERSEGARRTSCKRRWVVRRNCSPVAAAARGPLSFRLSIDAALLIVFTAHYLHRIDKWVAASQTAASAGRAAKLSERAARCRYLGLERPEKALSDASLWCLRSGWRARTAKARN